MLGTLLDSKKPAADPGHTAPGTGLGASPVPTWKGSCAFKASPHPSQQGEGGEELGNSWAPRTPSPLHAGEQQEDQPWSQVSLELGASEGVSGLWDPKDSLSFLSYWTL